MILSDFVHPISMITKNDDYCITNENCMYKLIKVQVKFKTHIQFNFIFSFILFTHTQLVFFFFTNMYLF